MHDLVSVVSVTFNLLHKRDKWTPKLQPLGPLECEAESPLYHGTMAYE